MRKILLSFFLFGFINSYAQNVCEYTLNFPGVNSFVNCGQGSTFQSEAQLTVEAWVNLLNTQNNQKIAGNIDPFSNAGYMLGIENGGLYCEVKDSAGNLQTFTAGTIANNEWTHIAFTFRVGGWFKGYINGQEIYRMPATGYQIGVPTTTPFRIGAAPWDANYFIADGFIDEVRVWSVERSQEQIREDMRMNLTTAGASGLLGYWRFEEGSGLTTADLSGNNNHGTLSGNTLPSWNISDGLYGSGAAELHSVTCCGQTTFTGTGFTMDLVSMNFTDTFVTNYIDCTPPGQQPTGANAYTDGYWVLDHYGASTAFQLNYKFTLPSGTVSVNDEANPSNIRLYTRPGITTGGWLPTLTATSASSSTGEVVFSGGSLYKQMIIGTTGNSTLTVGTPPSIDYNFVISPQPAATFATIRCNPLVHGGLLQLVDATGRLAAQFELGNEDLNGFSLDVSVLPVGLYNIVWRTDGLTIRKPFLVAR